MRIKLPKYLYGSWLLTMTLLLAVSGSISAQSKIKTKSKIEAGQSHQFPAAYYNSTWTNYSERTNGTGKMTIEAVDPINFNIPQVAKSRAPRGTHATVVYDNGPHINMPGTPDLSLLESVTLGMTSLGGNISKNAGFSIADDFELVAQTEITSISVYAYQTGATGTTINAMYVTIWDGDPSGGGSVVWGDQTTNVFGSVENSGAYRVSETTMSDRTRLLQKVNANISGLTLDAGTYWVEYSLGGTASSGPWQPPVAILGESTTGDAIQKVSTGWQPWMDTGTNTPQGLPFQIEGIELGGGSGDPCEQEFAYSLEDGTGDLKLLLFADDFEIAAGETMSVEEVTFRVFNNIGEASSIVFYKDDNGLPGDIVQSFSNVAPDSQTLFGTAYGYDAYDIKFTLPSAVVLDEGIFWVGYMVTEGTDGGTNFWVITDDGVHEPGQYSANGGVTWESNGENFSFKLEGECTSGGGTGGGFVCEDQFNTSNGIENGLFFGGTSNQQLAVDIIVGDDGFTAYGSNLNIFLDPGQTTGDLTFDFTIYDDQGGAPGNAIHSTTGSVKGTEFVGSNFGFDVHTFEVAFDDAAEFDANTTYWMSVDSNGVAWEATSTGIFGAGMAFFNDNTGGDWVIDNTEDLVYSLICEEFVDVGYCIPEGTNAGRHINNFSTTGGSENISNMGSGFSPAGYGDFYDTHSVAQEQGESVDFEVDIIGGISGFRIWVDWNQDGVFDTTEEVAYASNGYANSHTGTITVPVDALEGDTRMRIVSHWLSTTGDVDPCETGFTYGEFEDYKFTVGEGTGGGGGTACEQVFFNVNQPTAIGFSSGNKVANDITVAAGESFTLQTMTFDVVTIDGLPNEFDLEIFEDNGSGGVGVSTGITEHFDSSNMTFVENGTFSVYTQYTVTLTLPEIELTADPSEDARYWLSIASDLSTTGDFTYWVSYDYATNPDSYPSWQYNTTDGWFMYVDAGNLTKEGIMTVSGICSGDDPTIVYCEPELDCEDGDVITNVTFQEIDNTTGCSPNGYGDYTHLVATVQSGETYPISVTVGDGWANESVSVWIDFDNSGTFDEDEFFYIGTGSDEALTGNIDIPTGLADGQYRMRVRVAAVGAGTATWDMACDEEQGFGETEDYTVEVDGSGGDPDPCDAADVPYVQDFETATAPALPECTTVVNAGNGNNWKTSTTPIGEFTGTYLEYEYSSSAPANSWFFTQGINLEAGTEYEITYAYGSRAAAAFPENLKIAFGDDNDPGAMTDVLAEHVGILSGGNKLTNTEVFTVTDSGVYYFGFQAFSDTDQWFLYVDDIEIKEAMTTGIEDQVNTVFTYYPNPTRGEVTIAADKNISSVAVFNILGQQVLTANRPANGNVNLSDLATGTYLFRVMFEDGSLETFKVLKQ